MLQNRGRAEKKLITLRSDTEAEQVEVWYASYHHGQRCRKKQHLRHPKGQIFDPPVIADGVLPPKKNPTQHFKKGLFCNSPKMRLWS